ncbi:MAG: hypothetical protein JXA73_14890 [Acidobacteria bacterium]|nr:hypothetical protein [Acidobacteriota bacterium]
MAELFEFLFKYPPLLYQRGTIVLYPLVPSYVLGCIAAAAMAGSYMLYRRSARVLPHTWRLGLSALRGTAFLIALFLFLRPTLRLHSAIPQMNFVAVACDASRSMEIRDSPRGQMRRDIEQQILRPDDNPLLTELAAKFKLRYFSFSKSAERVNGFEAVTQRGSGTDLEKTLNQIANELAATPLAGIVLFTDGADNRSANLDAVAAQFRARSLPVYTVGIGSPEIARDIEILRVSAPQKILRDTIVEAEVSVRATGYPGRRTRLAIYDRDRQLQSREIILGRDGEVKTYKFNFDSPSAGPRVFRFHAAPFPDEIIPENNDLTALVRIEDSQPQILYAEGEPRWEYAFLRRALQPDKNLRLVTFLRQADGKFLRQGVESPSVLEKGFPNDKSELFQYKAIVLGSVEASFFTFDQLRMISDFVSQRGGGLLMLGGRSSFSQGGYVNTPLEDVLPVALDRNDGSSPGFQDLEYSVHLTPYGFQHPVTRLSLSEDQNRKRWDAAPSLVGFNPVSGVKPGATLLLQGKLPEARDRNPVILAFQRFGRGKSVAFTTASSWRWRMGQEHSDNFHALFWKQMFRWLVSDAPDPVSVMAEKPSYSPDDTVIIRAEPKDAAFMPLNDARLITEVKAPSGLISSLQLNWDIEKDGSYSASFKPTEEGIYEISSEAFQGSKSLGAAKANFQIAESAEEFRNAAMNSDLLKKLSSATGGRYYTWDNLRSLPEDISYIDKGVFRVEDRDLWDMPFIFLLLISVVAAEWILRKRKGLA